MAVWFWECVKSLLPYLLYVAIYAISVEVIVIVRREKGIEGVSPNRIYC